MDVYDHTGTLVAKGQEFSVSWSDGPDVVLEVMEGEAVAAYQADDTPRVLKCLRKAAWTDRGGYVTLTHVNLGGYTA